VIRQAQRAERLERRATPWWDPAPKMKAACKVATLNFANLWPGPTHRAAPKQAPFPPAASTPKQVWGGTQIESHGAPLHSALDILARSASQTGAPGDGTP